ncbi:MAG: hypothetical protein G01um101433_502 [Parcubacteria group bacterium Gr01-1014_33]|nr:MAG: hypothetical protein G01um101433_502 [Parcubacteria group bacterium Gr01-1014_33]
MDILPQYEREQRGKPRPDFSFHSREILGDAETPRMILWIMRLLRGSIKTERQAAYVLLGAVCLSFLLAVILFIRYSGGPYIQRGGSGPSQRELEEYRKIQPF